MSSEAPAVERARILWKDPQRQIPRAENAQIEEWLGTPAERGAPD
jgi:hypothetical protein